VVHACTSTMVCARDAAITLLALSTGLRAPGSSDDHVLLRSKGPHTKLGDYASIYRVTATKFKVAGVSDFKVGTSVLRHNSASRMLRAAVPLPTISAVLGHADPESSNQYMAVDDDQLLQCVLAAAR